jgi:phage terminase Nu1 subunit (DNA packaging protein)
MRKQRTTLAEPTLGGQPAGLWDSARLSAYLGCSLRHLFNLRKRGLPSYRVGDMVRFDIVQITNWLNSGGINSADERQRQLADLATDDNDNAECAAADPGKEFPVK